MVFLFSIGDYLSNYKDREIKTRMKVCELEASKVLHFVKYFVDKAFGVVSQRVDS